MKFGFVTCVQLGFSCMEAIYQVGGKLDLVITLKDEKAKKKSGRVYVDDFCAKHDISLVKVAHVNDSESIAAIKKAGIDWLFIIGWSQIAGKEVLDAPRKGVLGIHPSLLPIGRGRAAIPWAILKRLEKTGITLFKLDEGVDTGEILSQYEIPLTPTVDATCLYKRVNVAHTEVIKEVIPALQANNVELTQQNNDLATIWPGRRPEDGGIDPNGSVWDAECLVRAVTHPYPGAFIDYGDKRLTIWKAKVVTKSNAEQAIEFKDGVLECIEWDVEEKTFS
jgi:methionyl-tRNA formyltransferase